MRASVILHVAFNPSASSRDPCATWEGPLRAESRQGGIFIRRSGVCKFAGTKGSNVVKKREMFHFAGGRGLLMQPNGQQQLIRAKITKIQSLDLLIEGISS